MSACGPVRASATGAALVLLAACTPAPASGPAPAPEPVGERGPVLRVAIVGRAPHVRLGGSGEWRLERAGGDIVGRGTATTEWRIEAVSGGAFGMRARGPRGEAVSIGPAPLIAYPMNREAPLTVEGRAYRGRMEIQPTDSGLLVVNHVPIEEYLRGVVPIEMGRLTDREREALAAQAVASRTFALRRRDAATDARYDVVATVLAQAYGGVLAEHSPATEAVTRTAGLVLRYEGRLIEAVYSSTCGGSTAAASEVWRSGDVAYLQPVSDRLPDGEQFYCAASPRFRWTRAFDRPALDALLAEQLPRYSSATEGAVGSVREVSVEGTTASGRVAGLVVRTDRGVWSVRGNDVRYVLRDANGGILPSTYFSLTTRRDSRGALAAVTLAGRGNGHGIGMCQWGAIGRARAGQDHRRILATYYPGTTLARAD